MLYPYLIILSSKKAPYAFSFFMLFCSVATPNYSSYLTSKNSSVMEGQVIKTTSDYFYQVQVNKHVFIRLVSEKHYSELIKSKNTRNIFQGKYYQYCRTKQNEAIFIYIANSKKLTHEFINGDHAWQKRAELRTDLLPMLKANGLAEAYTHSLVMENRLIYSLHTQLNKFFYQEPVNNQTVYNLFFKNNQLIFNEWLDKYKNGESYDQRKNFDKGVDNYSHTKRIAWIYWNQIKIVKSLIKNIKDEKLRIIDLRICGGNFFLSLIHCLTPQELEKLDMIGIDKEGHSIHQARGMLSKYQILDIKIFNDNISDPSFVERLVNMNPDVVVANQVFKQLNGKVENHLAEWLRASRQYLLASISMASNHLSVEEMIDKIKKIQIEDNFYLENFHDNIQVGMIHIKKFSHKSAE